MTISWRSVLNFKFFESSMVLNFLASAWPFSLALPAWASHCTDKRSLILQHSLLIFFWDFVSRSRAARVITRNITILLPLFWSRVRGHDSATCASLAHWRDCSCCIASEQKCLKRLGNCFSLNCGKYWENSGHTEDNATRWPSAPLQQWSPPVGMVSLLWAVWVLYSISVTRVPHSFRLDFLVSLFLAYGQLARWHNGYFCL